MKKAYIVRFGAWGDHCHMTNLIKTLDEQGYEITFEMNWKGIQLHVCNPRIKHIKMLPPETEIDMYQGRHEFLVKFQDRMRQIEKEYDYFVNLGHSIETAIIAEEHELAFYMPLKWRRRNYDICYYDQTMKWGGFTHQKYWGQSGELWFTRAEHYALRQMLRPFKSTFNILVGLRGTMQHKYPYHSMPWVLNEFCKRHPEARVWTTGDERTNDLGKWYGETYDWHVRYLGHWPFRQVVCMAKYMDAVVTPETGLGICAGAHGTPKIMMLTSASVKNLCGNDDNDFSIQSPLYCSPCHRAIYNTSLCPGGKKYSENRTMCVDAFQREVLLEQLEKIYQAQIPKRWNFKIDGGNVCC